MVFWLLLLLILLLLLLYDLLIATLKKYVFVYRVREIGTVDIVDTPDKVNNFADNLVMVAHLDKVDNLVLVDPIGKVVNIDKVNNLAYHLVMVDLMHKVIDADQEDHLVDHLKKLVDTATMDII